MNFNFLPIYKCGIDELVDGTIIKLTEFCKKNRNEKCENFYKDIFNKEGIHVCPYGFNSFVCVNEKDIDIFTGLRVKDIFNIKKVNLKLKKTDNNKVITYEEMKSYVENYKLISTLKNEKNYLDEFIENTIHDVRKFNANIKARSEIISNKSGSRKKEMESIKKCAENIWAMSQLISTRLSEYDYLYAEAPLQCGSKYDFNFFATFDKIRRCMLYEAKKGDKEIRVRSKNGNCSAIQAYDSIKYMPFLLIDNALKYSFNNTIIEVEIKDEDNKQIIEIKSTGVFVDESEIESLFIRGYRGKNSSEFTENGSGIGLYLVKEICNANDIKIEINTKKILNITPRKRGVDEGIFNVILCVEKQLYDI